MATDANCNFSDVVKTGIDPKDVMDRYSSWAETYDKDASLVTYNPPLIGAREMLLQYPHPENMRIIDCAAGTGLVGEQLKKHGFTHIDALDASPEMLEKAKQKNVYENLICAYLGKKRLPIADNTYDALVAVGCFCEGHVKDDCFEEMVRIVKPGGKLVIAMREKFLHDCTEYNNGRLEKTMQFHHDNGLWKWLERKQVPAYYNNDSGVVYVFQRC